MPRRTLLLLAILAITWSGLTALYGQTAQPRVGCLVTPNKIEIDGSANFTLFVDQMPRLAAYALTLGYDSAAVEMADNLSAQEGINLMPGNAFPADKVTVNRVDPVSSEIQIAVSQPTVSSITGGFHVLATGTLVGNATPTIALFEFTEWHLWDQNNVLIDPARYGVEECFVEIGDSGSPTPEPTPTRLFEPLITPTPPSIVQTLIAPTPTPTFTPVPPSPLQTPAPPTATFPPPTATATDTDTPAPTPTETDTPNPENVNTSDSSNQSPLETPSPTPEETPFEEPSPTPTDTETPLPAPTDTPSPEAPTPTPMPVPTDTPTPEPPTPTPTPVQRPTATPIAQINRALGETIEVVPQADAESGSFQPQPYRLLAVAALFGSLALLLAFWQLYRRGNK